MDTCTKKQRKFHPTCFYKWLDHLVGWVEVDTLCSGKYAKVEIKEQWSEWKKLLPKFACSGNINKRRASLVLLCAAIRNERHEEMGNLAFQNIQKLLREKEVLITKAISWLLPSMVKFYKKEVADFVLKNKAMLPAIAVRETLMKIRTGIKTPMESV